ncbi:MAG: trypsin-like peptidase domain-containing protein, partial [Dehalococcoidia bacterium]
IDIAGSGFTPATLGDSDSLKLGDELLALGYPLAADLGTDLTVTRGIVSKLHAQLDQLEDLIQTDASINPGNSGGPLVNMKGEVVGINTVKVEYTDSGRPVQGLNFAIGASFGRPLVDELAQGENVHWIGINAIPNTAEIADYFGLPTSDGLLVYASASGSPADKTGFEPGDVLVEVEGVTVNSQAALCDILKSHHPDDVLAVAVVRGDTLLTGQIRGTPFKPTKVSSPATEGAIIGTITFAEDVTDNDTPIKPGAFFDYGITAVYGIFQYSGIPRGAEFEYVWLRDGETDVTDGEAWDSEPAGSFWVSIYNDEGLTPGKYELLLHVEGELLQSGGFVVGDESRAGAFGRYANSRLGFSLQYPVDWEVVDDGDVIYFSDPDTSLLAFVGVIELDGPLTPAAMAEQFMEGVGEETPGLEIEDGGEGTIAGVPAAWSTATFEDEGKEMSILVISAVRDDLGYNLGVIAATDDLDESGDAFTDVILESFRFLE